MRRFVCRFYGRSYDYIQVGSYEKKQNAIRSVHSETMRAIITPAVKGLQVRKGNGAKNYFLVLGLHWRRNSIGRIPYSSLNRLAK